MARQGERLEAILGLRDQIRGQNSGGQWHLGPLKFRTQGLARASAAWLKTQALELARLVISTFRTDETPRPELEQHGALAMGLPSVLFHEFRQTHVSLKLNFILQYRCAPRGTNDVSRSNTDSWAEPHWQSGKVDRFSVDCVRVSALLADHHVSTPMQ